MSTLVTGIGELVTNDGSLGPGPLGTVADAALMVTDGVVAWVGTASAAPAADRRVHLGGRAVVPGFVDSHAHLVFAAGAADVVHVVVGGRIVFRGTADERRSVGRALDTAVQAVVT